MSPPLGRSSEVPSAQEIVPELETERLRLRGWRDADLDDYAAMSADPAVMEFLGGVVDRDAAWRSMALHAGHWLLRGYGLWALESRADRAFLGRVGLWNPEGWPGEEIGWKLARPAWGHGYATEAAQVVMRWAWSELGLPRLISVIDPRNERSIAVARRVGMDHVRDWRLNGATVRIYGIERPA